MSSPAENNCLGGNSAPDSRREFLNWFVLLPFLVPFALVPVGIAARLVAPLLRMIGLDSRRIVWAISAAGLALLVCSVVLGLRSLRRLTGQSNPWVARLQSLVSSRPRVVIAVALAGLSGVPTVLMLLTAMRHPSTINPLIADWWSLCVVLSATLLLVALAASGKLYHWRARTVLITASCGAFVVGVIAILCTTSELTSDFRGYHEAAVEMVGRIRQGTFSLPFAFETVHRWRSVFYLVPLYLVFGCHPLVFQIANLLIHIGTSLMLYAMLRQSALGKEVGLTAALIFLSSPVAYAFMNIPTHDIIALPWLLALAWLHTTSVSRFAHGKMDWRSLVGSSFLEGVLLFVVDVQRSVSVFVIATLVVHAVICMTASFRGDRCRRIAYGSAVLLTIALGTFWTLRGAAGYQPLDPKERLFSFIGPGSDGSYEDAYDLRFAYFDQLPTTELRQRYALGRLFSELRNRYTGFLLMCVHKTRRLFAIGTDSDWGLSGSPQVTRQIVNSLAVVWCAAVLLLAMAGIGSAARGLSPWDPVLVVVVFGVLFWGLMLLSEIQPRYGYLILPGLSVLAAMGVGKMRTWQPNSRPNPTLSPPQFLRPMACWGAVAWLALVISPLTLKALPFRLPGEFLTLESVNSLADGGFSANVTATTSEGQRVSFSCTIPLNYDAESPTCIAKWQSTAHGGAHMSRCVGFLVWPESLGQKVPLALIVKGQPVWRGVTGQIASQVTTASSDKEGVECVAFIETADFSWTRPEVEMELSVPSTKRSSACAAVSARLRFFILVPAKH